ncbi:MAG: hypothetical protein ACHRHE_21390 [Tepidisphaerales bacterium]
MNIGAALLFAILLFIVPTFSELSTRLKFTELDRAGVVNAPALKQFHPDRGFGDINQLEYRRTVPDYIAASPLAAERTSACLGLLVTLVNAIALLVLWRKSCPARPSQTVAEQPQQ